MCAWVSCSGLSRDHLLSYEKRKRKKNKNSWLHVPGIGASPLCAPAVRARALPAPLCPSPPAASGPVSNSASTTSSWNRAELLGAGPTISILVLGLARHREPPQLRLAGPTRRNVPAEHAATASANGGLRGRRSRDCQGPAEANLWGERWPKSCTPPGSRLDEGADARPSCIRSAPRIRRAPSQPRRCSRAVPRSRVTRQEGS